MGIFGYNIRIYWAITVDGIVNNTTHTEMCLRTTWAILLPVLRETQPLQEGMGKSN